MGKRHGVSYQKRVADINRIYVPPPNFPVRYTGLDILVIYPVYGISERTFYNILNASADPKNDLPEDTQLFFNFGEE